MHVEERGQLLLAKKKGNTRPFLNFIPEEAVIVNYEKKKKEKNLGQRGRATYTVAISRLRRHLNCPRIVTQP